jgi:hypothetical protein
MTEEETKGVNNANALLTLGSYTQNLPLEGEGAYAWITIRWNDVVALVIREKTHNETEKLKVDEMEEN